MCKYVDIFYISLIKRDIPGLRVGTLPRLLRTRVFSIITMTRIIIIIKAHVTPAITGITLNTVSVLSSATPCTSTNSVMFAYGVETEKYTLKLLYNLSLIVLSIRCYYIRQNP